MQDKNPNSTFGIDINEYTTSVDFPTLAKTIDFLYLRSSGSGSGKFRVDKKFYEFAKKSREYGIPVGAYHYAVPSYDLNTADDQAAQFADILQRGFGDKDYGDLFPVVDVETPTDGSVSSTAIVKWIDRFRRTFEKVTNRKLMLYTGLFFIEENNNFLVPGKGYPLSNMPLWIAMYTKYDYNPDVPPNIGGWKRWRIWQYAEDQVVEGVGNPLDANWGPDNIELLAQPNKVTGLRANKKGNKVIVTWDRSSEADIAGYNVFANGYWLGTVDRNDTVFEIDYRNLPFVPSGPVKISVETFDFDGDTSPRATVTV